MPSISTQLLVIGGGSTGLGIAWDACLRGLKVILVEQNDLGQGTSGRYHGVLHSGGRYVLSDPPSARDCAKENSILRSIAPHTIEDSGGLFVSTPTDPQDFPDRWLSACGSTGVQAEEIPPQQVFELEPDLNPRISRAFRVRDASLDSFDLLHSIAAAISDRGGHVMLRHKLNSLNLSKDRVTSAEVEDLKSGELLTIGADVIVNAAGPWAGQVAALAGIQLPIALGKGTMVAVANRSIHTIVSRCRPPSDGDIIVPVGTVAIIGTTDVTVEDPDDFRIQPWEIDFLLAQGDILMPQFSKQRALRAWSGIRPLVRRDYSGDTTTREFPRAHSILNHAERDGIEGFISVFGGKLSTFRLMAEQTLDIICNMLGVDAVCTTHQTPLDPKAPNFHRLPARLEALSTELEAQSSQIVCECELVTRSMVQDALEESSSLDLDDLRRDLRLGMGPCQAGFCAYRAAGIASELSLPGPYHDGLHDFLEERWRGMRPIGWGYTLRQMELNRRIYVDILAAHRLLESSK
jgi:glycerol-3-phosphate dehydrogenase